MNLSLISGLVSLSLDLILSKQLIFFSFVSIANSSESYLKRLESDFDNKIQMHEVLPHINAKIVIDSMWRSGYPIDVTALMDDDAFKGILRNNVFVKSFMAGRYTTFKNRLKDLLDQINHELESRQS